MIHDPDGPGVVLAPHPDDAVLSAWSVLRAAGEVVVVSICAGVPPEGTTGTFDAVFGATDSSALMRARRAEDLAALAVAGRAPIHLDLLDAQYRSEPLAAADVRAAVEAAVPRAAWLCGPAAIGMHPDHVAVRDAALATAASTGIPLTAYADLPYAANMGWPHWVTGAEPRPHLVPEAQWRTALRAFDEPRPVVHALDQGERAAKLEALRCYETQFAALNGGPLDRLCHPEILGFELHWSIRPPPGAPAARRRA